MKLVTADGVSYALDRSPIKIGRSVKGDVVLTDKRASAKHATVTLDGDAVILTDLGSTNGTFLNGAQLDSPARLKVGDSVKIGDTVFTLEADTASVAEAATVVDMKPSANTPPAMRTPPPQPVPAAVAPPAPAAPAAPAVPSGSAPALFDPSLKSKSTTFFLELIPGAFGFLGLGWLYAGQSTTGLLLLFANMMYFCVMIGLAVFTAGFAVFCMYPIELVFVAASVYMLNKHVKENAALFR